MQQSGQPPFGQVSQSGQFQDTHPGYSMTTNGPQGHNAVGGGYQPVLRQFHQQNQFPNRDGQQPMQYSPVSQGQGQGQGQQRTNNGPPPQQTAMELDPQPAATSVTPTQTPTSSNSSLNSSEVSLSPSQSVTPPILQAPENVPTGSMHDNSEKKNLIRQQLILLLHANACLQRQREENEDSFVCNVAHCVLMKSVFNHMSTCQSGRQCTVKHCASSRQILAHWKGCTRDDCPICPPLKNYTQSHPNVEFVHEYAENAFNVTNPPNQHVVQQQQQPPAEPAHVPAKPWHAEVLEDHRNHLMSRLADAIVPYPPPADLRILGFQHLVSYVRASESKIYAAANSTSEYYDMMSKKIRKIEHELQETKMQRVEQRANSQRKALAILQRQNGHAQMRQNMPLQLGYGIAHAAPPELFVDVQMVSAHQVVAQVPTEFPASPKPENSRQQLALVPTPSRGGSQSRYPIHKFNMDLEELREYLCDVWRAVDALPEAQPFGLPVDVLALNIPDYLDVVKQPMDLQTIRNRMDDLYYKEPRAFCNDMWLMFENAWLYNKKSTRIYKSCTKLSEVFMAAMNPVMEKLGYCCALKHPYTPLSLFCFGASTCLIARDQPYYLYDASSFKYGIKVNERYVYCTKCFESLPEQGINLNENPRDTPKFVSKDKFQLCKNNVMYYEPLEACVVCSREIHPICANFDKKVFQGEFVCGTCQSEYDIRVPENRCTAKELPHCHLSRHIENRVNDFICHRAAKLNIRRHEVIIRLLCCTKKEAEVKPNMKEKYARQGFPEKIPYKTKVLFAFEIIDGVEVCFFGLHVHEYGSECDAPNRRRVYIAYLDSVHFFQPREMRTDVYHEILLGYLQYVRNLGYVTAHIWACPPSEGDDYIFHCHPPAQKIPKPKILQDWYKKMLDKGVQQKIVIEYKDIYRQAKDDNLTSPMDLPYFDGDFWPNVIEDIIREADKRDRERKLQVDVYADEEEGGSDESKPQKPGDAIAKSKKKPKKVSKKKMVFTVESEITDKLFSTLEKHKDVFFTIRLCSVSDEKRLQSIPIRDPDSLVPRELMDGRDNFLNKARDEHWEFSSLRRAKYSTLCLCHALHLQETKEVSYTCNNCNAIAKWHCTVCEDFDLCDLCRRKVSHKHVMEVIKNIEHESGNQQELDKSVKRCLAVLVHASSCRNNNCRFSPACLKIKKALNHAKTCRLRLTHKCTMCNQLLKLLGTHARRCGNNQCNILFCQLIRQKIREQRRQQNRHSELLMRRRVDNLQSSGRVSGMGQVQVHDFGSEQQQQQLQAQVQHQQQQHQMQSNMGKSRIYYEQQQMSAAGQNQNYYGHQQYQQQQQTSGGEQQMLMGLPQPHIGGGITRVSPLEYQFMEQHQMQPHQARFCMQKPQEGFRHGGPFVMGMQHRFAQGQQQQQQQQQQQMAPGFSGMQSSDAQGNFGHGNHEMNENWSH